MDTVVKSVAHGFASNWKATNCAGMGEPGAPAPSPGPPATSKIQILCLHGHAQTAEGFRAKTGSIRGPLKKIADFHFLEGRASIRVCW